jgi:hypothetical protein
MLFRLSYLFDRYMRQCLVKALVLPVINLYDLIYASASSYRLRQLDVAYNNLMRVILGIRRSDHFRIADMHNLTTLDRLSDRRSQSLSKFMLDVVDNKLYAVLRRDCIKGNCHYSMRSHNYVLPRFNTEVGRQRLLVRGLKLPNGTKLIPPVGVWE